MNTKNYLLHKLNYFCEIDLIEDFQYDNKNSFNFHFDEKRFKYNIKTMNLTLYFETCKNQVIKMDMLELIDLIDKRELGDYAYWY